MKKLAVVNVSYYLCPLCKISRNTRHTSFVFLTPNILSSCYHVTAHIFLLSSLIETQSHTNKHTYRTYPAGPMYVLARQIHTKTQHAGLLTSADKLTLRIDFQVQTSLNRFELNSHAFFEFWWTIISLFICKLLCLLFFIVYHTISCLFFFLQLKNVSLTWIPQTSN